MTTGIIGAAAVAGLLLLPGAAPAQQKGVARGTVPFTSPGPRPSAETPRPPQAHRPAHPRTVPGDDLFRARPWTYQPRYDRVRPWRFPRRLFFPGSVGFAGPVYAPGPSWAGSDTAPEPRTEPALAVHVRPDPEPPRPEPYAPGTPGPAKTLYVIRGCYAGDVPPQPGQLPDGCDPAAVRAIAPRTR